MGTNVTKCSNQIIRLSDVHIMLTGNC